MNRRRLSEDTATPECFCVSISNVKSEIERIQNYLFPFSIHAIIPALRYNH